MTKAELARELGVSRSYVTMIEQGKRQPSKKLRKRISMLTRECSLPATIPAPYTQEVTGSSPVPPTTKISLSSFELSKIGNKRYHPYDDEPDAHQIIKDFGKDHYHDTENKGDYSSNQT